MKKETILIVEDDGVLAIHLQDMMSNRGYSVLKPVKTGEEAIASAAAHKPDLILMDIHLYGEMNGISAAEKICEVLDTPIVYLTAYSQDALLQEVKKTTPYAFLVKPVSERELVANIQMSLYKHKIDRRLRESEEKFRLITQASGEIIWQLNLDGKITHVSPAIEKITGYTPEEALTLDFRAFFPETETDRATEAFIKVASGEQYQRLEFVVKRKDGILVPVEISVTPIMKDNKIVGIRGITHDVTERKQAEAEKEKLEARNRQLQKAESLGRMAGAIAHHFNNQLGVVIGNLELALVELSQGASPHAKITAAMKASNRAAEMSGLMLTYLGQSFDKREPLDLSEVCRRSLPMLQAIMPGNVVLETDLPSPGPAISANANEIQQVLTNLITNAWEAVGESRGAIRLNIKTVSPAEIPASHRFPIGWQPQDNAYACLEVTDAGCGIAEKDIEKLFDPFFTTKFTGRGMGLAVVLGVVKAHGGAVTVESEPGRGSAFRVFLPISAEEVPRQPDKASQPLAREGGGTVLLIDDEAMVRDVAAAMLKCLGFSVLEAKDGVEAVEVFRQHQHEIRCVLCDLTMPRMSGWETLTTLRKLAPDIPVILASGYDKAQVMAGDHPELPQVFLGKPYKFKGLSDAIGQALVSKKK